MTVAPDDFEGVAVDPTDVDFGDPEQRVRWRVDGDKTATWALGKLKAARTEAERLRANAKELIEEIQYQLGLDLKGPEDDAAFFEGCLTDYYRRLLDANPDLPRSYKLPNGKLKRRAGRQSTVVFDSEQLVAWLQDNAWGLLKVEPKVAEIKKAFPDLTDPQSGEVLPGIHFDPGTESFSAETY